MSLLGATLGLAMCVGMMTVFALGVLAPFLVAELQLTPGAIGQLSAVLFATGAVVSPAAGRLVDSIRSRTAFMLLFVGIGASWTGMALAPSYALLLPSTALAGMAMALANPATTRAAVRQGIDDVLLLGIAQSGSPVGSLLAGSILPPMALVLGWRGALLTMVILCAVGTGGTLAIRDWGRHDVVNDLSAARGMRWLSIYAFLMNTSSTSAIIFLPLYAYEQLDWSAKAAGGVTAVSGGVSIIGRLLWPRVMRSSGTIALALGTLSGTAALAAVLVLLAENHGSLILWVGVIGLGASAMAWVSLMMSAIIVEAGRFRSGRTAGVVMRYGFLGAAAGPPLFGWVVEFSGGYTASWAGVSVVFAIAALGSVYWQTRRTDLAT